MGLQQYKKKRDFSATPEPSGGTPGRGSRTRPLTFVVQKHDATRLHYDFRLELNGVLVSWAVPKGPSYDPSHKRLAVHVEDHPLDYGTFEGVIPAGQYGAGPVMLWDRGTWTTEETNPARAIARGKITFRLEGEKLKGGWTLTRLHGSRNGDTGKDNWLLIKLADDTATPGEVNDDDARSVKTGRTLEQIAAGDVTAKERQKGGQAVAAKPAEAARAVRRSGRPGAGGVNAHVTSDTPAPTADPAAIAAARKAPMPAKVRPQLCTLTDRAPDGDGWVHEIKFDGYRILARRERDGVRLITRSGEDWTHKFRPLESSIKSLDARTAIVDGEATVLDEHGHPSFQKLQNAIKARRFERLAYYAFDLLYLDGFDLTAAPLLERKRLLRQVLSTDDGVLRYSEHVVGKGDAVRQSACELALEGIICKRADAPYSQKRSRDWLKVKCSRRQEFVILGWSPPEGSRRHFGSLLLGAYDADGKLFYTGRVGTGFNGATLNDIGARLRAAERKECPADEPPTREERRGVRWTSPTLVAEVEFTEWTDDGRLRHPSFQGLREDKAPGEITIERPRPVEQVVPDATGEDDGPGASPPPRAPRPLRNQDMTNRSTNRRAPRSARGAASTDNREPVVAGVRITNPDRVLYPDAGITKLALARYYEAVADWILPFVADRPLSTVRCPSGRAGQCFFQKHIRETFAAPIKPIRIRESDEDADYISVDSVEGLVTLVQFGVLEIHPWGSTRAHLEQPDLLIFDLDPGEGVSFEGVKNAAQTVRRRLEAAGLRPFLKTTGGKGLHVVTPIAPDVEWDAAKEFCADIARRLAKEDPEHYVATLSKAKRRGRVFVDYLRNGRGATAIAPYSTRARAGAPVAVPLAWDELSSLARADHFTIGSVVERLRSQRSDPWKDFDSERRSLSRARAPGKLPADAPDQKTPPAGRPSRPTTRSGESAMPKAWSAKDERQYEHVKEGESERGRSPARAKEIAARTVNKQRRAEGRTKKSAAPRARTKR